MEGVPALRAGVNPATWMLEVSTLNKEHELGVDFAQVYRTSALFRCAARPSRPCACQPAAPPLPLCDCVWSRLCRVEPAVAASGSTTCDPLLVSKALTAAQRMVCGFTGRASVTGACELA